MAIYIDNYRDKQPGQFQQRANLTAVTMQNGKAASIARQGDRSFLKISSYLASRAFVADNRLTDNMDNVEMLVRFSVTAEKQVPGAYGVLNWDYTADGKGLTVSFLPARNVRAIQLYDDSASRTVSFANYDWENGKKYWLRWKVVGGNQHSVKIWPDGTPEPGGWTFTAQHANRTAGTRYIGYGTYGPNHTVEYDFFSAGTGGDTAPASVAEYITRLQPTTPVGMLVSGYGSAAFGSEFRPSVIEGKLNIQANARITSVRGLAVITNAAISRSGVLHIMSNASIAMRKQSGIISNAKIDRQNKLSLTSSAAINGVKTSNIVVSAHLDSFFFAPQINHLSNARVESKPSISHLFSAFVEQQHRLSHVANAEIDKQYNIQHVSNASLEKASVTHIVANARIQGAEVTLSVVTSARIEIMPDLSHVFNANIYSPTPEKLPHPWRPVDKDAQGWRSTDRQPQGWKSTDKQVQEWSPVMYD